MAARSVGTLVAFAAMVLLAGGNAVAVAFSNLELAPFWGGALRFLLAGAVFLAMAVAARRAFPRGRALVGAMAYGVVGFFGAYAFAYWGIQFVAPGLAQTLLALVPLATLVVAVLARQERFGWPPLAGSLVALAGVGVMFRGHLGAALPLAGLGAILGATLCFALANVVMKSFPKADIVATNAVAMLLGAALLVALSALTGETRALPATARTWAAVLFLVLLGSVAVFWLFLFVLRRWSASAVAYEFVLLPLVTVPLSARLTGETVTIEMLLGGALVLAGVYLGAIRQHATPPVGDDAPARA